MRTELRPVLVLSATLLVSWTFYALAVRSHVPTQSPEIESLLGFAARSVFWLIPCAVYLRKYWGRRWHEPIGFGFPLGRSQVIRTVVVVVAVSAILVVGTAARREVTVWQLMNQLEEHVGWNLQAPVFEELVFRGIVLSEMLNWLFSTKDSPGIRRRFWLVQLVAALVFTSVHWPWWVSHHGVVHALYLSGPVFVTGIVLGLVYANSRNIWGCIFVHWLNNELSVIGQ